MKMELSSLLKISSKLSGMSNVLEVLESSFRGSISAMLHDLHHLQESILKTKQVNIPSSLMCQLLLLLLGYFLYINIVESHIGGYLFLLHLV